MFLRILLAKGFFHKAVLSCLTLRLFLFSVLLCRVWTPSIPRETSHTPAKIWKSSGQSSKGLPSQGSRENTWHRSVHPKCRYRGRNSVSVLQHFGRHKGNSETSGRHTQKSNRSTAYDIVQQTWPTVNSFHGTLKRAIGINSTKVRAWLLMIVGCDGSPNKNKYPKQVLRWEGVSMSMSNRQMQLILLSTRLLWRTLLDDIIYIPRDRGFMTLWTGAPWKTSMAENTRVASALDWIGWMRHRFW